MVLIPKIHRIQIKKGSQNNIESYDKELYIFNFQVGTLTSAWSQADFFFAGASSPCACWSHLRRFLSANQTYHPQNHY